MATSSFDKKYSVSKCKSNEFIDEMTKEAEPTIEKDFQTYFCSLKSNKEMHDQLVDILGKNIKKRHNQYVKRPEITKALTLSLEHYINPKNDSRIYTAREVTFDYGSGHSCRVDFMRFKPLNNSVSGIEKGDFYCYEIKSSVEDFHSKNGHNFLGDYNYYVMPKDVYEKIKKEIPWGVGVFTSSMQEYKGFLELVQEKKARRKDRTKPLTEMIFMMFRSAARDNRRGEDK